MAHLHYAQNARPASRPFSGTSTQPALSEPVLWKLLLLTALAYIVWSEKFTIVFDFSGTSAASGAVSANLAEAGISNAFSVEHPRPSPVQRTAVTLPASDKNNTAFAIDPGFAARYDIEPREVRQGLSACQTYIQRFAPVAQAEMRKYGIPASIILAQALLESNAGQSKLTQKTNNHFGMKCFSKNCRKGHCSNFTDDSHKDFFLSYGNAWASYRDHSNFLKNNKRYRKLFTNEATDYKSWARGLAKAGYATDKLYANKLIALIETLELDQYDTAQTDMSHSR